MAQALWFGFQVPDMKECGSSTNPMVGGSFILLMETSMKVSGLMVNKMALE